LYIFFAVGHRLRFAAYRVELAKLQCERNDVDDRVTADSEEQNSWDIRVEAGTRRIKEVWSRLQPQTKQLLKKDYFDERGGRDTPLDIGDDSAHLVYSLGVFLEAAKANVPMHYGDSVPSCYLRDEVLQEAANLVWSRRYCDPEFTSLALHACIKHQTAGAASAFYFNSGKPKGAKGWLHVLGQVITAILFSILLAASIGNGLVSAFEHDAGTSSALAFVALFSYGALRNLNKPKEDSKWSAAFTAWSSLLNRDFHIGTAHGVERQLRQFISNGVHVPSVLFDLCAALQQGTAYASALRMESEAAHVH